ncbi:hypothetical protein HID58_092544, partial [Brassica napus]
TGQHNNPRSTHGPTTKPTKKENGSTATIFFSTCIEKKGIDTRQKQQTPPPNHRREIQAGAFCSLETIHASKLELPRTRVALRRTHHQSPSTGTLSTSSTIHPTSNRDVRRETVERVTNGSHDAKNKAGQLRQGEREPPETEAGYTRQTDRDIPESTVTEEERRRIKLHLIFFFVKDFEERTKKKRRAYLLI